MKIIFFDESRLGVLLDGRVIDVDDALGIAQNLHQQLKIEYLIENFAQLAPNLKALEESGQSKPLEDVRIGAPITRPRSALCCFTNYQDRVDEFIQPPMDFFYKGATAMLGCKGTVELPDIEGVTVFQPEPELGVVIGKKGKHISEQDAMDHVFGYVNFIDVSARGIPQRRTTFLPKGLETWAPLGPVIVTKNDVPDPHALDVRLWINGELKQNYNTGMMVNRINVQIAWLSRFVTLHPGDVIACGTHHQGLSPINDGDHVEMEVAGLERLAVNVRSHGPVKTAHWRPPLVRAEGDKGGK